MGDPLSTAASVIAVIQVSGFLLSTLGKYVKDVKDAKKDVKLLQQEVESLERVASDTRKFVEKYTEKTLPNRETLRNALDECEDRMRRINKELEGGTKRSFLRKLKISRSLEWPFDKEEVEDMIRDLERYKGTISLSIQTNHIQVSIRTHEDVKKVNDTVSQTQNIVQGTQEEVINTHQDVLRTGEDIKKTGEDVNLLAENVDQNQLEYRTNTEVRCT
ncbi:hypothetical protein ABW19_dt0207180 [Dactylella cylindrospora]|nr:hypothetical protein ABW19_dt0207180 [Dactylella cylindrospora]